MRKALFFLGILTDEDLEWMIANGNRRQVPAATLLIREGQPVDALYIVVDGALSVSVGTPPRLLARLHVGEIVGEMSFVDSRPPSATVMSAEDSVLLELPRGPLSVRLDDPPFAARFYKAMAVFLADRLRAASGRMSDAPIPASAQASKGDDDEDELDPAVLDKLTLAGARMEHLMQRLRGY